MTMPTYTMRELLEAGIHFGHHTRRWNPKMKQYIFGVRNGVHIIDLQQTVPMMDRALKSVRDIVAMAAVCCSLVRKDRRRISSKKAQSVVVSTT